MDPLECQSAQRDQQMSGGAKSSIDDLARGAQALSLCGASASVSTNTSGGRAGDEAAVMFLDPDGICGVASFVDTGRDLMNICLAVGPKEAAKIRTSYLRGNDQYLVKLLRVLMATPFITQEPDQDVEAVYDKVRDDITVWMEMNNLDYDWRKRINAKKLRRHRRFRIEADNIFNNLALASSIGLVDVVRHLVDLGVNVSDKSWRSVDYKWSPIQLAVARWDFRIVECLLSSDTLDFEGMGYHRAMWMVLLSPGISKVQYREFFTHPKVDVNATFPNRDNYMWSGNGDERSMLMILVLKAFDAIKWGYSERSKILIDKLDILLKAGADPTLPLPEDIPRFGSISTALQFATKAMEVTMWNVWAEGYKIEIRDEKERTNLRQGWGTIVEKLQAQG